MIINHLLTGMILQVGGGGFFGVHVGKMAGCFFWCFFLGFCGRIGNFRIEYVPTENQFPGVLIAKWGDLMMIFHDDQKHLSSSQVRGLVAEK